MPKKRGRPATGKDPMLAFRAPSSVGQALDAAAAAEADTPSRSEMIRRIVMEWLHAKGLLQTDASSAIKRAAGALRAKEAAVVAVKKALESVDAPDDVKAERKRKLVAPPETGKIRRRGS